MSVSNCFEFCFQNLSWMYPKDSPVVLHYVQFEQLWNDWCLDVISGVTSKLIIVCMIRGAGHVKENEEKSTNGFKPLWNIALPNSYPHFKSARLGKGWLHGVISRYRFDSYIWLTVGLIFTCWSSETLENLFPHYTKSDLNGIGSTFEGGGHGIESINVSVYTRSDQKLRTRICQRCIGAII